MSQGQVPPPGSPQPKWRVGTPAGEAAKVAPVASRKNRLVGPLVVLLALLGAGAGLLLYLNSMTSPDFLSLSIREYTSRLLPVNPMAYQDSVLLTQRFARGAADRPYTVQT